MKNILEDKQCLGRGFISLGMRNVWQDQNRGDLKCKQIARAVTALPKDSQVGLRVRKTPVDLKTRSLGLGSLELK